MNRLECVGKSPKFSPTAMGQLEIISAGDGVQFLEARSRKESTEQVVKEHTHGRLPVLGCGEPIPSEAVGSTSRSCSSGFQPKSVSRGSVSPTKHVALSSPKVCLSSSGFPLNSSGRGSNSPTRRIDWSEPKVYPNRIGEYTGPPVADRQVLMTAIKIKPKWSPPKTASTEDLSQFRPDTSTAESLISHKERRGNPVSVGQAGSGSSQPTVSIVSTDECTEEEDGSDDIAHRAPLQLFAEFLSSVMGKDYVLASKLCQMILIYEPENPEAKQFIPLIEEKLLLAQAEDQQEENRDSGAESNTEDSGDSSCIDSDSDSESSGSSDHSSFSSSEEEEEERVRDHRGCHPAFVPS